MSCESCEQSGCETCQMICRLKSRKDDYEKTYLCHQFEILQKDEWYTRLKAEKEINIKCVS